MIKTIVQFEILKHGKTGDKKDYWGYKINCSRGDSSVWVSAKPNQEKDYFNINYLTKHNFKKNAGFFKFDEIKEGDKELYKITKMVAKEFFEKEYGNKFYEMEFIDKTHYASQLELKLD